MASYKPYPQSKKTKKMLLSTVFWSLHRAFIVSRLETNSDRCKKWRHNNPTHGQYIYIYIYIFLHHFFIDECRIVRSIRNRWVGRFNDFQHPTSAVPGARSPPRQVFCRRRSCRTCRRLRWSCCPGYWRKSWPWKQQTLGKRSIWWTTRCWKSPCLIGKS